MFKFTGFGNRDSNQNWRHVDRVDLSSVQANDANTGSANHEGRDYHIFDTQLLSAINTALALGMPMLVTGEPGVGKTALASRIAYELDCAMLTYRVKSTSQGTDLLYRIDNMRRLVDTHIEENRHNACDVRSYISFNALGLAVLRAQNPEVLEHHGLLKQVWGSTAQPEAVSSVVLIDEIDKAPADFPNDLLEEIKDLNFTIPEYSDEGELVRLGFTGDINSSYKPFVLITSNAVRALPEAFLRRCVC